MKSAEMETSEQKTKGLEIDLRHRSGMFSDIRVIWRHSLRVESTPRYTHMRVRMPAAIVDDVMETEGVRSAICEVS